MKTVLKSVALCTCFCIAVHNECSAMQAIADEIRKGALRKNSAITSSSNPPIVDTPRPITAAPPETNITPRDNLLLDVTRGLSSLRKVQKVQDNTQQALSTISVPGAGSAVKKASPKKLKKGASGDTTLSEHSEQVRFVGGQRVVTTPAKKA